MTGNILSYLLFIFTGAALGAAFFGTLWITVRRLPRTKRPLLVATVSLFARFALAVAVLTVLAHTGGWAAVVLCVVGFITVRVLMIKTLSPAKKTGYRGEKE